MTRIFLIRHAEPAEAWGGDAHNPGLSARGRAQAEAAATALAQFGALDVVSSPMRRCVETAAPFAGLMGVEPRIEPRVSEVVAPAEVSDRRAWLKTCFPWDEGAERRRWASLDPALRAWRDEAVSALKALRRDTAVFSHFIAINAISSHALERDESIVCTPTHASITELALMDGALRLVRMGVEVQSDDVR